MKSSPLSRTLPGLPFATVMALLLATLGVSILSSYDVEVRWLRFGSVLLAVGLAMWLPALWAAVLAASISLVSGLIRGGTGELGILRPETLLEAVGLAATALLTAWLRDQIAWLVEGRPEPASSGAEAADTRERRQLRPVPVAVVAEAGQGSPGATPVDTQPPAIEVNGAGTDSTGNEPAPSLLAFHRDESLASYTTYLACLRLELAKTASIIKEVRSCGLNADCDDGETSDEAPMRMDLGTNVKVMELLTPRGFATLTSS